MLKKQIRLNHENEGRRRKAEEMQQVSSSSSAREAETVDVHAIGSEKVAPIINEASLEVDETDIGSYHTKRTAANGDGRRTRRKSTPELDEGMDGGTNDDIEEDDDFSDISRGSEMGSNIGHGLDRALTVPVSTEVRQMKFTPCSMFYWYYIGFQNSGDEGLEFHIIRPLLALPHYSHLSGTKSRPKLRCGMKDCRRHTSYYCVKCTRELQHQASGMVGKVKVYALCSPMVENNIYCFYRHSLGLGEREKAVAEELKAIDAQKPKKHSFHLRNSKKPGGSVSSTGAVVEGGVSSSNAENVVGHISTSSIPPLPIPPTVSSVVNDSSDVESQI